MGLVHSMTDQEEEEEEEHVGSHGPCNDGQVAGATFGLVWPGSRYRSWVASNRSSRLLVARAWTSSAVRLALKMTSSRANVVGTTRRASAVSHVASGMNRTHCRPAGMLTRRVHHLPIARTRRFRQLAAGGSRPSVVSAGSLTGCYERRSVSNSKQTDLASVLMPS